MTPADIIAATIAQRAHEVALATNRHDAAKVPADGRALAHLAIAALRRAGWDIVRVDA